MLTMSLYKACLLACISILLGACEKEPGFGGEASIYGKIYVKDYNATFTVLEEEYYGGDVEVYLVCGDDKSYSDRLRTNYDGTFEFRYLRKGHYRVYAYSRDSTLQTNAPVPVILEVEITKRKQHVETPDIVIFQ
ncbi:MAG TPA: hypothetical protein P5531_06495 [Bacteroidales bacterium]|nr:hypothetical protein [Bacteroidales bacterium]HSA43714.1 hypothetical protein [Bacteroidales bacterium]